MTVLPPRTPVEAERRESVVSPAHRPEPGAAPRAPIGLSARRISPERVVIGILLAAVGVAWLLDEVGVSVPWALAPAAGVVVIGIALVLSARTRDGHAPLVVWGGIMLAVALLAAVVRPVGGPVGDRFLTPTVNQWPVATSLAAGNLTIDLGRNPLPANGRLTADVTAGNVVLHLPSGPRAQRVQVMAHVGVGQIKVDGVEVKNGMGLDWSSPDPAAVVVDVHVGTGQLEVDHG